MRVFRFDHVAIIASLIIMGGCGSSNESDEGEEALEIQQWLDNKDFDKVIERLENKTPLNDDQRVLLGLSYTAKAGYGLSDMIKAIADSEKNQKSSDLYIKLAELNNKNEDALYLLGEAKKVYTEVVSKERCSQENKSHLEEQICAYNAISGVARSSIALQNLGDVKVAFDEEDGKTDDNLTRSVCALKIAALSYAAGQQTDGCVIGKYNEDNLTFKNEITYERIKISSKNTSDSNQTRDYLIRTTTPRNVELTDGYCDTNQQKAIIQDESHPYPCPIQQKESEENLTAESLILETLNTDLDLIGSLDASIQDDVTKYRDDIDGADGTPKDGKVTSVELAAYIESKNK